MKDLETLFAAKVQAMLADADGPALWVFRGFGPRQLRTLAARPDVLPGLAFLPDGALDFDRLEHSRRQMLAALLAADGPRTAAYEQLLALCGAVADLSDILQLPVFVVENNALCPWQPSPVSPAQAQALYAYFQSDKSCPDPAVARLAEYY